MKPESSIGVERRGDGLAWARVTRAAGGSVSAGEGAPALVAGESVTFALPSSELLFRTVRVPSSDPAEIAGIARNLMEAEAPLDPAEMVFSHEVLASDAESALVLAGAAPIAAVESLREAAGVDPGRVARIDAAALGFVRALSERTEATVAGRRPVLLEEDVRLTLLLLEDGLPVLVRSVGSARAATGAALTAALRLALLQAEMERGPAEAAPLALVASGTGLLAAATTAAKAAGREVETIDPASLPSAAEGAARRTDADAAFNLFPESWTEALAARRTRRRNAIIAGGAAALWLVLALILFGWPSWLAARNRARQAEVDSLAPAEAAVQEVRGRIRIIDRYSDRTWSPLEILREVSLALPDDVTLDRFIYDGTKREAQVEGSAHSTAPAYEFSNRLKGSPLLARNDIVQGPTENKNKGRTTFTIRLAFAGGEGGEGGTP